VKYLPRVLRYLRPYWKLAVFSVVLILLGALTSLLVPWPLKILFDSVLQGLPLSPALAFLVGPLAGNRIGLMLFAVIAGVVVTLLQNALTVLDNYVNTKIDQSMILDFRSDLFRHAQRLSLTFHDQRRSGMLIYAINSQADAAARLVMTIPPLAQSVLTLIGMFWVLCVMDWRIALLSLTVVPFLYYSVGYYMKNVQQRLYKVRAMEGESLSIIHEAMSMLRVIVAFGREDHEHHRFRSQGERTIDARIKVTVRQTLFSLAVNTITAVGTALVLGFGSYLALQGRLTAGQLLVVMAYLALVYKPLETISTTVGSLQELFISLKVSFDLLDTEPEIQDSADAAAIGRARGHVRFEGVHFHYQGRIDTLKDISFDAQAGQVVAIVGPTGAGKTTLMSLIPRFYDVRQGRILLDGKPIRDLTLKSLREQISIVLQEPLLFSGSIADNIRYGRLDASMDEVIESAKAANAHDFILRLPGQYDAELGERGAKLSGGERQRIAVARAFLKNAPILILDEPTSSIDSKTEAIILDALDRLMVGRTTFLIAHRLSTIRRADVILVVDQGRLVEQGTHSDLLRRGGLYKQLYDMQTKQEGRKLVQDLAAMPNGEREAQETPA
jgi:ATP-binding cassette subfamily B protein